jgi:hypothetical protein
MPGGDVSGDYQISPDGSWVVYRADQEDDDFFELYSVPIEGGAVAEINGDANTTFDTEFHIDPGSAYVYFDFQYLGTAFILTRTSLATGYDGTPNWLEVYGWDQYNTDFEISPGGRYTVFIGDRETVGKFELWSTENLDKIVYLPLVVR